MITKPLLFVSEPLGLTEGSVRASGGLRGTPDGVSHLGIDLGWSGGVEGYSTAPDGLPRKEVIQPQLPLRLPCYDFVPVITPTLGACLSPRGASWPSDFRCWQLP